MLLKVKDTGKLGMFSDVNKWIFSSISTSTCSPAQCHLTDNKNLKHLKHNRVNKSLSISRCMTGRELWPLYLVLVQAPKKKKKKSGSPTSTPCRTAIRALRCNAWWEGYLYGGLGWIGKFWWPALRSPYLWPCPSSLCLNWSQSSLRAPERSCHQILQETRWGSK